MRPAGWPVTLPCMRTFLPTGAPNYLVLAGWWGQREGLPVLPGSSYLANRAATHCWPGHTVAGRQAKHREAASSACCCCWSGSRQTRTWRNAGGDGCCLLLVILTPAPPPQISLRSWTGLFQLSSLLVSATIHARDQKDCLHIWTCP